MVATWKQTRGEVDTESLGWELEGKVAVATAALEDPGAAQPLLASLREAGPDGALRAAILAAELGEHAEARTQLAEFADATAEQRETARRLFDLLGPGPEAWAENVAELEPAERQLLVDRLGWYGELALAPRGGDAETREELVESAQRTFAGVAIAGGGAFGGCCLGVVAWLLFLLVGRPQLRFGPGPGLDPRWIETFAVWLVAFVGLGLLVRWLGFGLPDLARGGLAALGSLVALAWLPLRGIGWPEAAARAGLHRGMGWVREVGAGLLGYLLLLPLMGCGLIVSALLVALAQAAFGVSLGGAHPIALEFADAEPARIALIFVLACVVAPVLEEITFRGILYTHLRQLIGHRLGQGWSRGISVLLSGTVCGFVFAAVHPQGIAAIPVLTVMGLGFCLLREWRGSLIAPMVTHAVNNAVALTAALAFLG